MIIQASVIFEIMGRPKEYLVESMNEVVDNLSKEKGVKIIKRKVHEPKELDDRKGIFSTFSEIDAEFENNESFFVMMFNYMPANVEVISPSEWKFKRDEFNTFVNELLRKLHQYDNLAKGFIIEKNNMQNYINELHEKLKNFSDEIKMPKYESTNLGEERQEKKIKKEKNSKKSKKKIKK